MLLNTHHCIFLLLLLMPATNTLAQQDSMPSHTHSYFRHELSISIGRQSNDELFDGNTAKGEASNSYGDQHHSGTFALTYRYYVNPKIAIGAAVAYENNQGSWTYSGGGTQPSIIGSFKRQVFTAAPEVTFIYYGVTAPISLYGCLGLGASYQNEVVTYDPQSYNSRYHNGINPLGENMQKDQSRTHWNILLCPIGIRLGGRVNLFTELALGYKGVFAVGAMMKFGKYTRKDDYEN